MLHEFLFDKATDFFLETILFHICKILVRILLYDVVRQIKKIDRIII